MERQKQRPAATEAGEEAAARRRERLAEALRDNLQRRKAQARRRKAADETPSS